MRRETELWMLVALLYVCLCGVIWIDRDQERSLTAHDKSLAALERRIAILERVADEAAKVEGGSR